MPCMPIRTMNPESECYCRSPTGRPTVLNLTTVTYHSGQSGRTVFAALSTTDIIFHLFTLPLLSLSLYQATLTPSSMHLVDMMIEKVLWLSLSCDGYVVLKPEIFEFPRARSNGYLARASFNPNSLTLKNNSLWHLLGIASSKPLIYLFFGLTAFASCCQGCLFFSKRNRITFILLNSLSNNI